MKMIISRLYVFLLARTKAKPCFCLLAFMALSSNLFSQEISKDEERLKYEMRLKEAQRKQAPNELKKIFSIQLNSNASQKDFDIAVKDLNDSKKFNAVKSTFENKKIKLDCKEAMLPEDIKEIIKKSGLGISKLLSE